MGLDRESSTPDFYRASLDTLRRRLNATTNEDESDALAAVVQRLTARAKCPTDPARDRAALVTELRTVIAAAKDWKGASAMVADLTGIVDDAGAKP